MPLVVPQLKTITLGGAVTGLGIESTSFRHGLPHESVREMDVLLRRRRGRHRDPGRRARRPVPPRSPTPTARSATRCGWRSTCSRWRATSGWSTCASPRADLTKVITDVCDLDRGAARLRRRHRVRPAASSTSPWAGSPTTPAARVAERLHRAADLLPLHRRAGRGPPDRRGLPLALGHRLVLVLARAGRAAPGGAQALAAALPPLGRLPPHRRPRPAHGLSSAGSAARGQAAGGAGRAGRRDPGGAPRRVPRRRSTATSASPRCGSARSGCAASAPGRSTRWRRASCTSTSASGRRCPSARATRRRTTGGSSSWSPTSAATSRCTRPSTTTRPSSGSTTTGPPTARLKDRYDPRGRLPDLYAKVTG